MSAVPYQPVNKRTRTLFLSVVTAVAAGATTAALDWASARWIDVPPAQAADPIVGEKLEDGSGAPREREKRGRVLGIKWASKRKE